MPAGVTPTPSRTRPRGYLAGTTRSVHPACRLDSAAAEAIFGAMLQPSLFHPAVSAWFDRAFAAPTPAQSQAWPLIKAGRNALIAAPTGSGKTLAAFLAAIDDLVRRGVDGTLTDT